MLPTTPLHPLLLRGTRPSRGDDQRQPDGRTADHRRRRGGDRLQGIADFLLHDRPIATRIDDSSCGDGRQRPRPAPRARFAPGADRPAGRVCRCADLLAMGGELKATFCLLKDGGGARRSTSATWRTHAPSTTTAADRALRRCSTTHRRRSPPICIRNICRRSMRARLGRALIEVQHHHAHVAACLAENGRALDARRCLGSCSTGLAGATTARFGAASSCLRIIATRSAGVLQAGRHAGRRASRARTLAQ